MTQTQTGQLDRIDSKKIAISALGNKDYGIVVDLVSGIKDYKIVVH